MAIIYTNNSSGAIRRARRSLYEKLLEALAKHIKYQVYGFDCDDNGRIKLTKGGRHTLTLQKEQCHLKEKKLYQMFLCQIKLVLVVLNLDNSWKIEASKNFTVGTTTRSLYGSCQEDIKTAGRKV